MRDVLKNLFCNEITLENNGQYYYTISPFELTNSLGKIIAVLQEYNFTKKDDGNAHFSCKLYRTKEGNWYDLEPGKLLSEKGIFRMLKSAVDAEENDTIFKT